MLTILPLLFISIVPRVTSQCIVGIFVEFGKRVNNTTMVESRRGCRFVSVAPCKPYMIFAGAPLKDEGQFRIGCFPIFPGIECHCGPYGGGCNADPATIRATPPSTSTNATTTPLLGSPAATTEVSHPKGTGSKWWILLLVLVIVIVVGAVAVAFFWRDSIHARLRSLF